MILRGKKIRLSIAAASCIIVFALNLTHSPSSSAQWDKDVLEFRGRLALQDGKYSLAIEQFNILAQLDTNAHWTYFYRGMAKYNLGDYHGALRDFDRSVRINPIFTNGYHFRAIAETQFGNYDAAISDFEKAIELRPGNIGLYYSRGLTYFFAQQFDLAVKDFDKYLRFEKDDPAAYLNRGASYLYLGDTTRALTDYNKAIKLDRFDPEGYIRRARVYVKQKNYASAIDDMNKAIDLDETNTIAYFDRALMYFENKNYNAAMSDLNKVLQYEPGNALTLYNRSLLYMQLGDYESALDDLDRVLNINPGNVLAYFNRASCFIELGRLQSALRDYDKTIELYPDFAKAYMNRSYVENELGMKKQSKADYEMAQKKISEYQESKAEGMSFADTTYKFKALLWFDADFAKTGFDNELLQHRDIDVQLKPLYRATFAQKDIDDTPFAFSSEYMNLKLEKVLRQNVTPLEISSQYNNIPQGVSLFGYASDRADIHFLKGLKAIEEKQYNQALSEYNEAIDLASDEQKAVYLMNRATLKADMINFIASIENNVQTLTMDDQGATKTRVSDRVERNYDYSDAISDLLESEKLQGGNAYVMFNLGNLYCMSSQPVTAIDYYGKAIKLYPEMGEAYYNRALVLIFIKDKEKGCIDLSKAGELGIKDAYGVIKKYCRADE